MKIIITETQAKSIGLINEDINPISQFESLCKIKTQELNKIYNMVKSMTVQEILEGEVNMKNAYKTLENIEYSIDISHNNANKYIETLPDSKMGPHIDNMHDTINQKLNSLQIIVMDLEKLQLTSEEHRLTKEFFDIKPTDITSIQ